MGKVIHSWEEMADILAEHRARSERIVSTNGVFDLLHVGHVRTLQAARALGDLLVVGINSDDGTRRLKGPERPFVPQEERAEVLAALACVDYVTFFDEPTPSALLEIIRPAIHVKGGDYTVGAMPETEVVERHGGTVVTLPFVAGHSTTDLARRVLANRKLN
ncbi:MAG TPA: D-glycero-beta-D-manno-heptose 1-phosphate adenylyltransferase [Chthonomonadaceae bacterium]|nr:D-glycero-beta-D-manno-heptose 1-phosphate adenylyltransferase [Chthonomonadaceae bacterium]